jgi:hypothetical protein
MTLGEVRDDQPRVQSTLVRNLPIALLFCTGYFVFFAAVWGPLRPWKLAVALCIVLGLALGLRLRDRRREARAARLRRVPGGRAASDRAAWPWWRRAGLLASGTLLCAAAVYQSLGIEVDIDAYPLISGLCLILGCAVGATLIGYGWPRERWKRRRNLRRSGKRATPARSASPPEPPTAESASATFSIPVPKDSGFSGAWGGFGSRPARPVWTPGSKGASAAESGPVPKRFRGLRLLRSKRAREAPMATSALVILAVFGTGFAAALLYWILGG